MSDEQRIQPATPSDFRKVLTQLISEVSYEHKLWIPPEVEAYMARVISQHLPVPRSFDGIITYLHEHVPKEDCARYPYLQTMGDLIVYFSEFIGMPSTEITYRRAQIYYDDAAHIGKKTHHQQALILEQVAVELSNLADVLPDVRLRLVRGNA